ncbi:tetratricopeptide repeat protein [Siccirubricoccus phaeus]|uniref:tetratricopeptide repeat protein n=1 Tax=Siccirubricoccus phaeus TaxID=2595053 RepID=UPI0011F249E4|nr:tetratricopeptide repeat protein [Siccirubricoccus phaeus]
MQDTATAPGDSVTEAPAAALAARLAAQLGGLPAPAALAALAEALAALGWAAPAAALARQAALAAPADPAALSRLGRLAEPPPEAPPASAAAAAEQAARAAPPAQRLAAWRGVLALFPGHVAAQMEIGHALRAGGDPAAALPHFAAARAAAPAADWAALAEADTLRQLGRLAAAELAYREVLRRRSDHPAGLAGLAECRRLLGDAAAAGALFARLAALAPGDPAGSLGLAELHLAAGEAAAAAEGFRAVLARHPGHRGAMMGLGHAAMALGQPAAAQPLFAAVAAAEPGAIWALLPLAEAARALGEPEVALTHFTAALALAPDSLQARLGRVAALAEAGRAAEALAEARAAVAARPEEPGLQMALGQAARALGEHELARTAFAAAAALRPGDPAPLVEAAAAARALGEPRAARALLEQALARDPGCAPALEHLGGLHRAAGELAAALASFAAGIATGRPGPWSYLGAAEIEAEQGRLDAALALLAAGEAALPGVAELPAKRLELLRRSGAVPAALAAARALPADRFPIWFERVVLEHEAGDAATAAALLAAPPPAPGLGARARALHLRGLVLADHWRLAEAEKLLAEAAALAPEDPWPPTRLAMLRLARSDAVGARAAVAAVLRIAAAAVRAQGRTPRIAQTFHGQLLDELALEPALLARLQALAAAPAAARLAPLAALVRERPEHFGAAHALAVALRQAGGFAFRPAPGAPPLPARLAQYWHAAEPPADLRAMMAGWQRPGLAARRFDDAAATAWMAAHQPPEVQAAWRRARTPTHRADLLRLALLATEGGWWADADDLLFGDLAALAPPGATLVLYQEDLGSIGNNLMGAAPGHPVLREALRQAVVAINRGDADMVWLQTGPGLLTRVLAGAVAAAGEVPPGVLVHDHLTVLRQVALHCLAEYKTRAHWMRRPEAAG